MKNVESDANTNPVITMPAQFQKAMFKPFKGKNFILNVLYGNVEDTETFMAVLNDKAGKLSDDFDQTEWVIAKEIDPPYETIYLHDTFFLYPKDTAKTYKIEGSKLPSSPYCDYDSQFGYDEHGEYYDDIIVDHKIFGLIATINAFDTCGYTESTKVMLTYLDCNHDLSSLIVDTEEKLRAKRGTDLAALDRMMSVVSLYLKDLA